jgi:hypothetical protein
MPGAGDGAGDGPSELNSVPSGNYAGAGAYF